MTTRTLTGVYSAGYTLSGAYGAVVVVPTAQVSGVAGSNGSGYHASGGTGGDALVMPNLATATIQGAIDGGAGGVGSEGGFGGFGGAGVLLGAGGSISNSAFIRGGDGASGGDHYGGILTGGVGGNGGDGVDLAAGGTLVNTSYIFGGVGGSGGASTGGYAAGQGGAGGPAVYAFGSGISIVNDGQLIGGAGGSGGPPYQTEGVGVFIDGYASIVNAHGAYIQGGMYLFEGKSTITNDGAISGPVHMGNGNNDRFIAGSFSSTGDVYGGYGTFELAGGAITLTGLGPGATLTGAVNGTLQSFNVYAVDAAASLDLTGANAIWSGRTLAANGPLSLAGGASLTIDNTGVVEAAGPFVNAGAITIVSTGGVTDLRVLKAATLSGGGAVTLAGSKAIVSGNGATAVLTNVDNTLSGVGNLGAAELVIVNQAMGVIDATGALSVRASAGSTLVNAGLMEASGTGALTLVDDTVSQAGGGTILAAGGLVSLQGDDVIGGTLAATGSGRMNVNGTGAVLDGTSSALTNSGLVQSIAATPLTLEGSIVNSGKINLFSGKIVVGATGATLSGKGQVNLNASSTNLIVGAASTDTLTNVDNRIDGAGKLGDGSMVLVNDVGGQILGNQTVALTIDTGAHTIINAGLIENAGKGGTTIASALDNTGTLLAVAGTLTLAKAVTGAGHAVIDGGTLYAQAAFNENVTFSSATGQFKLTDWFAFTASVAGLSSAGTNSLDLVGFGSAGVKATYSGTTASGVLVVSNGTQTATIHMTGDFTHAFFTLSNDGSGGTKIIDPSSGGSGPPSASLSQAMASLADSRPSGMTLSPPWQVPRQPFVHAQA